MARCAHIEKVVSLNCAVRGSMLLKLRRVSFNANTPSGGRKSLIIKMTSVGRDSRVVVVETIVRVLFEGEIRSVIFGVRGWQGAVLKE
jgi:hypothetical protein